MALGSQVFCDLRRMEGVDSQWGITRVHGTLWVLGVVKVIGILSMPGDGRDTVGSVYN